jgi:hypothetical protein
MKRLLIYLLGVFYLPCFAQNSFVKTNNAGQPHDIIATADGGAIITGNGNWVGMCYLQKIDVDGNVEWANSYDPNTATFFGNSVVQTPDGGYAVLGHHFTFPDYELILIRTDSIGDTLWTKRYPSASTYDDYPNSKELINTSDNGFLIAGTTNLSGAGGDDMMVIKLDNNGAVQWQKTYGTAGPEEGHCVVELPNGYLLGGMHLIRMNDNGDTLWTKYLASWARDVSYTSDEYLLATVGNGLGLQLTKWDTTGNLIWERGIDITNYTMRVNTFKEAQNGQYIVSGTYIDFNTEQGTFLILLDTSGNIVFEEYYPDMGEGFAYEDGYAIQLNSGDYIVTGVHGSGHSLVRTDAQATACLTEHLTANNTLLTLPYTSPALTVTTASLNLNHSPALPYFPGTSITTVHCDLTNGLNENSETKLLQVYPNPAQDFVKFDIETPFEYLTVVDATGKQVLHIDHPVSPTINIEQLPVGIYHIQIHFNGEVQTASFIKVSR